MNSNKHDFNLKYIPQKQEWAIFDGGVFHSDGFKSRKDAQDQIDAILNNDHATQKELLHFTKDWKTRIRNSI